MGRIKNWARKIRERHNENQDEFNAKMVHDQEVEDRFRDFLTGTDKKAIIRAQKLHEIIDKELNEIKEIDWKVKLEAQFEREYPGRKAIWKGKATGLFKKWLEKCGQFDSYFEKKDYESRGTLTLS